MQAESAGLLLQETHADIDARPHQADTLSEEQVSEFKEAFSLFVGSIAHSLHFLKC